MLCQGSQEQWRRESSQVVLDRCPEQMLKPKSGDPELLRPLGFAPKVHYLTLAPPNRLTGAEIWVSLCPEDNIRGFIQAVGLYITRLVEILIQEGHRCLEPTSKML